MGKTGGQKWKRDKSIRYIARKKGFIPAIELYNLKLAIQKAGI